MASEGDCEQALRSLAALLAEVDADTRAKYVLDRTVSMRLTDLDITWSGRLSDQGLTDLTTGDDARAQIRASVSGDDLVALVEGRLAVAVAFATGRIRVQASPFDLLRLGAFL